MVVGVCTGLGECLAVPGVLVAGGDVVCGVIVIADCKMECIGTRATLLVEIIEGVNARGGVSVVVPSVGVAGILEKNLVCAVVDGKVQSHGTVAAGFIGGNESRSICRGIIMCSVP